MYRKSKLNQAIAIAIASSVASVSGNVRAQDAQAGTKLEEIIVTASKRSENLQDVPLTVQALNAEALENLDINSFSDYVKQLPNVHFAGRGPGQNDVYIRGLATGRGSLFQSGGIGAGPTVAFYVDEAPLTSAGRNIDVYMTDMNRVEVLAGPQGTLYGASSQAGTIRLITNKPDPSSFAGGAEFTLSATEGGEESWGVEGFVNIPLMKDRLALRIAAYDISHGGYIDNVRGTTSWAINQNVGTGPGQAPPAAGAQFLVSDNANLVEDDFNDDEYIGGRVSAKLVINESWDLNLGYMTQKLEAEGVFDYTPSVGDLKVQRFQADSLEDEFDQFSLTVEGRMGWLDVIYAGSYLERDILQNIDLVAGTQGAGRYQVFYNCTYNAFGEITLCHAPDGRFRGVQDSDDTQHELRFSTDANKTLRFVGGVWYAESNGGVSQEWEYHSPDIKPFAPNAPHSEATHFNPNTRDQEVAFFNDLSMASDELSFFGEMTYAFTDKWSAIVGLRHYDIDITPRGSFNFVTAGTVDNDSGGALDGFDPTNESDLIKKLTLSYAPSDDALFYATYSEGFRRGGFNRGGEVFFRGTGVLAFPAAFTSDTVENYELGWKATWLDSRLRFNGAAYFIDWSDIQIDIFDTTTYEGILLFTANVGEAEVKGIEADMAFLATDALTLSAAISLNETELTSRPSGAVNLLPAGSDLPLTPTFQGNANARYDFRMAGMDAFAQLGVQHRGSTFTTLAINGNQQLDSYSLADASFGVKVSGWNVRLLVTNLTNERTELFKSIQDGPARTVTSVPRTISLKLSRDF